MTTKTCKDEGRTERRVRMQFGGVGGVRQRPPAASHIDSLTGLNDDSLGCENGATYRLAGRKS